MAKRKPPETTNDLFISHSSQDDAYVRELERTLSAHALRVCIDSREFRPGDKLEPAIKKAIAESTAFAVLVSPAALQSKWVGKEINYALTLQKKRGAEKFPVIPLSLDGTKLGVLESLFPTEPIHLPVSSSAAAAEAAVGPILVALGRRKPADIPASPQPAASPLEDLVLELTDLKFDEKDGKRRASARARLVYEPAAPGQRRVHTEQFWRFVAPIGPIEAEELRWYLEKFAIWPSDYFKDRAHKVEENLVLWGQLLHTAALPAAHTANVMNAWSRVDGHAGRRFSVLVDPAYDADAPVAEIENVREAATVLLNLPWELLHDGTSYLFQGATPTRVRRRLPSTRHDVKVSAVAAPIRILLITARPEDEECGYFDHRASALPLVAAMEALGGLVNIHVLSPPTLPALREELDRTAREKQPYHVVHFDGHGVFDRSAGLGGLCFEDPQDTAKLEKRRHVTVFTNELGPLLHNHGIPLVFLEACQTATALKASESVASALLRVGVASVVAMSHSVLIETASRFVQAFYAALARGARVGDAMLEGQRKLSDDKSRGHIFGAGELKLHDWFVPVLFQEKDDPQLFRATPAPQADLKAALANRLGAVPPAPQTTFVGRSRELLALQRLLRHDRYAVVRGQGGEGKTTLAAEFARWMVRSHQARRATFVSVETHSNALAVLDAIGGQLLPRYSAAAFESLEKAFHPIEQALAEQPTVLVVDNMESILQPEFLEAPEALSEDAAQELKAILAVCDRLLKVGNTRIIFTSREPLPAPFDAARHRRELHQLDREDAVKLVERVLNADESAAGATLDAARESIESLVDAVHGHARTLALLAPSLRTQGVDATRESLVNLMAAMEKQFPGSREQSLFASVELSLRRMSLANRDRARALAVFRGGVDLDMLRTMTESENDDVNSLASELIQTGLATPNRYNHLTLNPALCPYLRSQMEAAERETLTARWVEGMLKYTAFLIQQARTNAEVAATLTALELPNLFALLEQVQRRGDAELTIDLATDLYRLLQSAGKPRLLERVGQVRDAAAADLGASWSHAQFEAARTRIEHQLSGGRVREALGGAQQLLERARASGEKAYYVADYNLAMACFLLGRILESAGRSEQALPLLDEARERSEAIELDRPGRGAAEMARVCLTERGDCLRDLGRLDEAVIAYEESIRRAEKLKNDRGVAVGKLQLGTVRMQQRRYLDALKAFEEARDRFAQLHEPGTVAVAWHQIGMVYQETGRPEAAEDAYRKSLSIKVRLGDSAGQATTLNQLGNVYSVTLNRLEEAASYYRQAADKFTNPAREGAARSNLAETLRKLRRFDEAREQILRAIECDSLFGHASQPWTTWAILAMIETATYNPTAAANANRKAIACYLAYRRDGGENYDPAGRICLAATQHLLACDAPAAASLLAERAASPDLSSDLRTFIQALQAIVVGSRDRTLADAPELDHTMAAEILFLLETLETPQ
jgi:tetratricopeptide (TPR) repeat protein